MPRRSFAQPALIHCSLLKRLSERLGDDEEMILHQSLGSRIMLVNPRMAVTPKTFLVDHSQLVVRGTEIDDDGMVRGSLQSRFVYPG